VVIVIKSEPSAQVFKGRYCFYACIIHSEGGGKDSWSFMCGLSGFFPRRPKVASFGVYVVEYIPGV